MVIGLALSVAIAFFVTLFITPKLIRFFYRIGVVALDLNKPNKPILPSSGGIAVAIGILAGLLSYVGIQTFVYHQESLTLLAVTASVLIVMFVGFFDDLNVKSSQVKTNEGYDIRVGIPRWAKPLLTFPAAIPLMAISVGETTLSLPFLGEVNFGILYPLLLVPIGIVGASNMVNMLGGHNGIEAGTGLIYMLSLGLYSLIFLGPSSSAIFFISAVALLAFLRYNWYPSKILPGDSLTYLLGSLVASGVIVGNMEKVGVIIMTPFIIQGILKFYSKYRLGQYASDLGISGKYGTLKSKYGKDIFSLTHLIMNLGNFKENQITKIMMVVQLLFGLIPFLFV